MTAEYYLDIENCNGYKVSNLGKFVGPRGPIKIHFLKNGYGYVKIRHKGKFKNIRAHILVLKTFRGDPMPGEETRHLDGDKKNNTIENLRWGTKRENYGDKIKHGSYLGHFHNKKGWTHPLSKFSNQDIETIREKLAQGVLQRVIAYVYGVNPSTISKIKNGIHHRESEEANNRVQARI